MITIGHTCTGRCICEDLTDFITVVNPECPATGHACDDVERVVSFSPDGKRVASGVWDDLVTIWDTGTGAEVSSFEGGGCGSGMLVAIRKEAGLVCTTSSSVRL